MSDITIGLFGTCGGSKWRDAFMVKYDELDIKYFNPQVDNWTPELASVEADHLVNDEIVLFPVTNETSGLGSLAETGFSMFQAMKSNTNRYFVFMIASDVDPEKVTDAAVLKESVRARALVKAHLNKNLHPNVFVCNTLQQVLDVSIELVNSINSLKYARKLIQ